MFGSFARFAVAIVLGAPCMAAADSVVYDDALQNTFQDYSYGGGAVFNNANPVHNGADSIAFTGNASYNAVSFFHAGGAFNKANYSLRFFVNGGTTGGQMLALYLESNGGTVGVMANPVSIGDFIAGGQIPANAWAQVDIPLNELALTNDGSFDRIDLQTATGAQPVLYIDDVTLIAEGGAASSGNYLFSDSFEPEYMFVPQWASSSIRVYQRSTNTTSFSFLREAPLGGGIKPNAVAFAPDGGLWVVDDGNFKLLRYTQQAMLTDANPVAGISVGPVGNGSDIFDLAFFGNYAYVCQSDFGATNQILRFALSALNAGNNTSTTLSSASLSVPAGLAFDAQGRLWIANDNNNSAGTLVRMSTPSTSATIDVTISNAAVGHAINGAEGLAFDEYGTLWVGDNAEPTLYGFAAQQLTATGNPAPIAHIDMPTPGGHPGFTGYVGGIAFDRHGDVRANYEYDYTVRAFTAIPAPWGGPYTSYTSSELTALAGATTDPGRGGIAIWPVPRTVHH